MSRKVMNNVTTLIAVFMLSACASVTPMSETQGKIERAQTDIPKAWFLPLPDDLSQVSTWREIYDDPLLNNYLETARTQNYDLRIAHTRLAQSAAALERASALLRPRINASVSASGVAFTGSLGNITDSYGLGLSGTWEPDLFGQSKAAIAVSRADLAVQRALTEGTRQSILAQTARAYIRAVGADLQVKLAKTNLDFLTESRRISEARYRAGDTAKGDFSFAEANYQSALAGFENTKQSARAAKRALSILLGDYPSQDLALSDDIKLPKRLPPRDLPARTLERRPDVLASRARVIASAANLRSSQLADWPSVALSGGLTSSSRFKDLFDPSDYIARLGVSLLGNLFDGGSQDAAIAGAQAALDGSLLNYEATLRAAMGEISDNYDRADNLRRILTNLQAASDAANEALRLSTIQYDLGESSLLDVLQVQTRVNSIDATLIRTKTALLETTISAYQSIGGL